MDAYLQVTVSAAFFAALAGGVHCAAMCGPLIGIACGTRARNAGRAWMARSLAYNAGRIASYVAAGAITGALGAAGLALRGTPALQQLLLAAMGASLILMAAHVAGIAPIVNAVERAGAAGWRRIAPLTRRFLPVDTPPRAFGLGLILGWLPCGMVYVTLMAAAATADPLHGALVMGAFGLGTLPNTLAISAWSGPVFAAAKGRPGRFIIAAVIAVVGVLGLIKAAHPATAGLLGECLDIAGLGALFGGR